jgi:hypothetical protein
LAGIGSLTVLFEQATQTSLQTLQAPSMNSQSIIVPKISTLPVHEPRARAIVRWLVRKNIVEEALSTCGRTGNRMAHAIAPGARDVVLHPEVLPFGEPVNGLEIITKRCI